MCHAISTCQEIPTPFLLLNVETALFSVLFWLLHRERMVREPQSAARYPYSYSDSEKEKHQPPWLTAAKWLQPCPTLCDPIDGSPPGSPVPGILQARTPEWVDISFSNAWKWKVKVKLLSCVWLFATPWTAAYQAPPSKGFSRQEYWSGVPPPSLMVDWVLPKSEAGRAKKKGEGGVLPFGWTRCTVKSGP